MQLRSLGWLVCIVGMIMATSPARADANGAAATTPVAATAATAPDADAARISAAGHSVKWNWTPPGRNSRFGHAETLIHTAEAKVRKVVLDFGNYKQLAPSITTSRVVGHEPDGSTNVYLQMGVMNNTLRFWDVTRFAPPRPSANGVEIEGQKVPGQGNIEDAVLVWTIRAVGAEWTVLKFDLMLRPSLPAPQELLDQQLRDSALDAVNSIHDRTQGSRDFVPYGP